MKKIFKYKHGILFTLILLSILGLYIISYTTGEVKYIRLILSLIGINLFLVIYQRFEKKKLTTFSGITYALFGLLLIIGGIRQFLIN